MDPVGFDGSHFMRIRAPELGRRRWSSTMGVLPTAARTPAARRSGREAITPVNTPRGVTMDEPVKWRCTGTDRLGGQQENGLDQDSMRAPARGEACRLSGR
jgi:hypothetical protein